jgi:hypothetical protein
LAGDQDYTNTNRMPYLSNNDRSALAAVVTGWDSVTSVRSVRMNNVLSHSYRDNSTTTQASHFTPQRRNHVSPYPT